VKENRFRPTPDMWPIDNIRVVDGDTIDAEILLPFNTRTRRMIRLKSFWADELEGPWAAQGLIARQRLWGFLEGKATWIHAGGCRIDRYGRILATLVHEGRLVSGREVLGDLQLTEKCHKDRKDLAKKETSMSRPKVQDLGILPQTHRIGWAGKVTTPFPGPTSRGTADRGSNAADPILARYFTIPDRPGLWEFTPAGEWTEEDLLEQEQDPLYRAVRPYSEPVTQTPWEVGLPVAAVAGAFLGTGNLHAAQGGKSPGQQPG
jgi:hypothetical protein